MEKAFSRMLLVLKQCEGGIESGARTHDNRGIIYLSEFGHTFLMHIKETIYRAEQAQQAEPRCGCGDGFTSDAMCANCLAAKPPSVAVPDGVARAIEAVAAAIYFADSSDYLSTMWDTLRFLSPEIATIAESDTRAAWERAEQARAMLAAAQKGGA